MKYFSIEELVKSASAERLAIDNTPPRAAQQMLTVLVEQLLDPIRRRYGAPIIVTSGYRCPALNTAVGGVANSHHIVGCAADIVGETPSNLPQDPYPLRGLPLEEGRMEALQTSLPNNLCEHSEGAPHRGGAVQRTEGVCRGGSFSLFHLIIQMQREGAIRFTQLIAEKDYRWLHISYVPGMLRNQIIDVNVKTNDNDDDNHQPEGKRCEAQSTLVQTSEMQASLRFHSESSQVSLTSALTLSLEEKPSLSLKKDYQDSG